jgi:hypothetical protein
VTSVVETCWGLKEIDDKPYWHLVGVSSLFNHNVRVGKGALLSVSAGIAAEPHLENAQTPYSFFQLNDPKEQLFEEIRYAKYPMRPPRLKSLYVFDDYAFVERALREWFRQERKLVHECRLLLGSITHKADTVWLNAFQPQWAQNAERYWAGEMTDNPFPEVLVHGALYFPAWKSFGDA